MVLSINLSSGPEQTAHPLWTSVFPAHSCCLDHHIQQLCGCRVCCAALAASVGHLTPFLSTQIESWQRLAVQPTFLFLTVTSRVSDLLLVLRCRGVCLVETSLPCQWEIPPLQAAGQPFFAHPFDEAPGLAEHVGGCLAALSKLQEDVSTARLGPA